MILLALLLISCAVDSQQGPYQITLSRGGGFTGLVRGYHLYEGGKVEAWSRMPGSRDSLLWQTKVHPDSVKQIRDGLESSGALATIHRRSGNMTTSVAYTTDDTSFSWSWGDSAPKNLKEWYQQAHRFCAHLTPKPD